MKGAPAQVLAPFQRRLTVVLVGRLFLVAVAFGLPIYLSLRRSGGDWSGFTVRVALATGAVVAGLSLGYLLLLRISRRLQELAAVTLVIDQAMWSVVVYLTGGVASGATSLYGITCVVGGLLLGAQGATVAAIAGGVFFSLVVVLLQNNSLPLPPDQPAEFFATPPEQTAYYLVVNYLVLAVVTLLVGYLAERLRLAGGKIEQAERRADEAERMAAMGRLAAGLAHEIRNPLSSIAGSVRLVRSSQLEDDDKKLCDLVLQEANRLEELVTDMLHLSRPHHPRRVEVDLAELARQVVDLAAQRGRSASDVKVAYRGLDHAWVSADLAQMRQLLWNLVRNAVEASRAGDEVWVTVEQSEGSITLSVEDEGVGLDDGQIERIFDAFYTTRSQGTGIGLAVVKRIADEHGFSIGVDRERTRGAAFRLTVPG